MIQESVKRTTESSKNMAPVVLHPVLIKEFQKLFFESFLPVMFFLTVDVADDALHLARVAIPTPGR
jgi:hypothetical protein